MGWKGRYRLGPVVIVYRQVLALGDAVRRHTDADQVRRSAVDVGAGVGELRGTAAFAAEQADDPTLDGQLGFLDFRVVEADLETLIDIKFHRRVADDKAAHGDDHGVRGRLGHVNQAAARVRALALAWRHVTVAIAEDDRNRGHAAAVDTVTFTVPPAGTASLSPADTRGKDAARDARARVR